MTIKKTMKVKGAGGGSGNGAVADRFRLDAPPPVKASAGGPATTVAFVAGLLGLAAVGILTYVIFKHWEFLKPA